MASFSVGNVTSTTAVVNVTGLTAGTRIQVIVRRADDDTTVFSSSVMINSTDARCNVTGLEPDTSYVCVVTANYVSLGAQGFTTLPDSGPVRPGNWSWSPELYPGCPYEHLNAALWNRFTARINDFREYAGVGEYDFTIAVSGVTPLATLYYEAEEAIRGIPGHGTIPTEWLLDMEYFNGLAAALNAVT